MVLLPAVAAQMSCKSPKYIMSQNGTAVCIHSKCTAWNLTDYVVSMVLDYENAKETYWRMWSECHFLRCVVCKQPYPVKNSAMCEYHPEVPDYFPIQQTELEHPIGRYPCCGDRAFKFEPIKNPFGCQFRSHVPDITDAHDKRVQEITKEFSNFVVAKPSEKAIEKKHMRLITSDQFIRKSKHRHWWKQMMLGEYPSTNIPTTSYVWSLYNSTKKKKTPNSSDRKKLHINDFRSKEMSLENAKLPKPDFKIIETNSSISMVPPNLYGSERPFSAKYLWKESMPEIINQDNQRKIEGELFDKLLGPSKIITKDMPCISDAYDVQEHHNYPSGYYVGIEEKLIQAVTDEQLTSFLSSSTTKIVDKKKKTK